MFLSSLKIMKKSPITKYSDFGVQQLQMWLYNFFGVKITLISQLVREV